MACLQEPPTYPAPDIIKPDTGFHFYRDTLHPKDTLRLKFKPEGVYEIPPKK